MTKQLFYGTNFKVGTFGVTYQVLYFIGSWMIAGKLSMSNFVSLLTLELAADRPIIDSNLNGAIGLQNV